MLQAFYRVLSPSINGIVNPYPSRGTRYTYALNPVIKYLVYVAIVGVYLCSAKFTVNLFYQFAHDELDRNIYRFIAGAMEFTKVLSIAVGMFQIAHKIRGGYRLFTFGISLTLFSIVASMGSIAVENDKAAEVALHSSDEYTRQNRLIATLEADIQGERARKAKQEAAHQITKAGDTQAGIDAKEAELKEAIKEAKGIKGGVSAAGSFFAGLTKLLAMVWRNFPEYSVKVFFEFTTACLIESIGFVLSCIVGFHFGLRLVELNVGHATPLQKEESPVKEAIAPSLPSSGVVDFSAFRTLQESLKKPEVPLTNGTNLHKEPLTNGTKTDVEGILTPESRECLYQAWKEKVRAKELAPSHRPGWKFIASEKCKVKQPLTAGDMNTLLDSWQEKGVEEGYLIPNPNYKNGLPKFILKE